MIAAKEVHYNYHRTIVNTTIGWAVESMVIAKIAAQRVHDLVHDSVAVIADVTDGPVSVFDVNAFENSIGNHFSLHCYRCYCCAV